MRLRPCVICGKNSYPWLYLKLFKSHACESCATSFSHQKQNCRSCKGNKYVMVPMFYKDRKNIPAKASVNIDITKPYYERQECQTCSGTGKKLKINQ